MERQITIISETSMDELIAEEVLVVVKASVMRETLLESFVSKTLLAALPEEREQGVTNAVCETMVKEMQSRRRKLGLLNQHMQRVQTRFGEDEKPPEVLPLSCVSVFKGIFHCFALLTPGVLCSEMRLRMTLT